MEQESIAELETEESVGIPRLMNVYHQLNSESDLGVMLAVLLSGVHEFSYGLTESNTVNDRQGKSRITFTAAQKELIEYSESDNYDVFEDKALTNLFVYILNAYLEDKQEIPMDKPRIAKKVVGTVKTVFVMLISSGQYGVISMLNIPPFIQPIIDNVFKYLSEQQSDNLSNWIEYLEENESEPIVSIVTELGSEFWGSDYMNAKAIFDLRFHNVMDKFKDYDKTYEAYLRFRGDQIRLTRNIGRNVLLEFFDDNPEEEYTVAKFDWYRKTIIDDFQQIFSEDQSSIAIQKLIYG